VVIHERTVDRALTLYTGTRLKFSAQRVHQGNTKDLSPLSTAPIAMDYSLLSIQIKRKKKRRAISFAERLSTSQSAYGDT
jgi:hypothetical protein